MEKQHLPSDADLIDALGGPLAVSRALSRNPVTVRGWKARGIPRGVETRTAFRELADMKGVAVDPRLFPAATQEGEAA